MEKGGRVRVIEGEVRRDDPVEYFLSAGVGSTSRVPEEVMTIEVPQNKEICGGGRMEGEKESVLPYVREERIGVGVHVRK